MVDLGPLLCLVMLEEDILPYHEYVRKIPQHEIPSEYATYALFLKNKGKASKRISKEAEWNTLARDKGLLD